MTYPDRNLDPEDTDTEFWLLIGWNYEHGSEEAKRLLHGHYLLTLQDDNYSRKVDS